MNGPLPCWREDTCVVCPARELGPGDFDVTDQPGPDYRYNRQAGWRVDRAGNAVCVHPYRVGLPVELFGAIAHAEEVATARFASDVVTAALRRVLSQELTSHE